MTERRRARKGARQGLERPGHTLRVAPKVFFGAFSTQDDRKGDGFGPLK